MRERQRSARGDGQSPVGDHRPRNASKQDPNTINIEPGTLVLIITALLLLPLLITGFLSQ